MEIPHIKTFQKYFPGYIHEAQWWNCSSRGDRSPAFWF